MSSVSKQLRKKKKEKKNKKEGQWHKNVKRGIQLKLTIEKRKQKEWWILECIKLTLTM